MPTPAARRRGRRRPWFSPIVFVTAVLFLASFVLVIWVNFDPRMTVWTRLACAALVILLAIAHSIALSDFEERRAVGAPRPSHLVVITGEVDPEPEPEDAA